MGWNGKNLAVRSVNGFVNQLRHSLFFNYIIKNKIINSATQYWTISNQNNVSFSNFFEDLCCLPIIENHMMCVTDSDDFDFKNETFSFLANKFTNQDGKEVLKKSFEELSLKEHYKNKINSYIENNNIKNSIGVHLRTTCKNALLKNNKASRFQPKKIEEVIKKLKETDSQIYLATDNQETQDKMIDLFGNRIIYYEKIKNGKEKFEGVYEKSKIKRYTSATHTIFDFYILQECETFIGSNESTFSIMINWIRDKKDKSLLGSL